MPVLTSNQRKVLEAAVKKARQKSERGAEAALKALAVHEAQPYSHLSADARVLRNSLRAKARLLRDKRAADGTHEIAHVAYELAYEYWHSLLFASFLEANHLLMHPTLQVAVTLEECEELATEENFVDKWAAAAAYASHMLPAIFRTEDPVMQVRMATEDRLALEGILDGLERSIFTADDALGWVYQFWQSDEKERINKSGDKIDGEKLPAVTQLFTEPYMVRFLIDNTIGAWWAGRQADSLARSSVDSPGNTRTSQRLPYLRLKEDGSPAAGVFDGWPKTLAELTCLDPCMGSGHFVSALFSTLAPLRMAEDGLSKDAAADAVIAQNLHGLELDPRCTQIAAFNLALTAWKWCGRYRPLPPMNLACSGIAPVGKVEDWVKLVDKALPPSFRANLEKGMRNLYALFQKAPELGSLLDPAAVAVELDSAHFADLQPYLEKALGDIAEEEAHERGVMAAGIAKAWTLLARKYNAVFTNVPFLGQIRHATSLRDEAIKRSKFKSDLSYMLLSRILEMLQTNGACSIVLPMDWLIQTKDKELRKILLNEIEFLAMIRLGRGAFVYEVGKDVMLLQAVKKGPNKSNEIYVEDYVSIKKHEELKRALDNSVGIWISQLKQLSNAQFTIRANGNEIGVSLSDICDVYRGLSTGDSNRFYRNFFEVNHLGDKWDFLRQTSTQVGMFNGMSEVILWENESGELAKLAESLKDRNHAVQSWRRGKPFWGKYGIAINRMGSFRVSLYLGEKFSEIVGVIIPRDSTDLLPLWCYFSSENFIQDLKKLTHKLDVEPRYLRLLKYDSEHWQSVAAEKYPNGLPQPYSNDPTQWLFHGHPAPSTNPLQVALARLAGYRWPAEADKEMELDERARVEMEVIRAYDGHTDADGILCIPALAGEESLATRLRAYLQDVWGSSWQPDTMEKLLAKEGATSREPEAWLRDETFAQHCKVFGNRPFLWHIWDGRKDGFSAFVNYHKLDAATLQKLIFTYLGDYLRQCDAAKARGESGADGKLLAARELKRKLEAILEGEAPYDIHVRWKKLYEQPIGWRPDLNDGVRLNIRPFMIADVLRKKPNIKWGVDRGKNADGKERNNDKHYTLAEKKPLMPEIPATKPVYTVAQAAHMLGFNEGKVRDWLKKLEAYNYEAVEINEQAEGRKLINFIGILELAIIGSLREGGFSMQQVWTAREALKSFSGVPYPFARQNLREELLKLEKQQKLFGDLSKGIVTLDGKNQTCLDFIRDHLERIEFTDGLARTFYPMRGKGEIEISPFKELGTVVLKQTRQDVEAIYDDYMIARRDFASLGDEQTITLKASKTVRDIHEISNVLLEIILDYYRQN